MCKKRMHAAVRLFMIRNIASIKILCYSFSLHTGYFYIGTLHLGNTLREFLSCRIGTLVELCHYDRSRTNASPLVIRIGINQVILSSTTIINVMRWIDKKIKTRAS